MHGTARAGPRRSGVGSAQVKSPSVVLRIACLAPTQLRIRAECHAAWVEKEKVAPLSVVNGVRDGDMESDASKPKTL